MSFEGLQERLAALQETTAQLKDLIDKLQQLEFEPGSVALGSDEENVGTELSLEISQIIREEDDELELLHEEVEDLRGGRPGSDAEHTKLRLREGVERLKQELKVSRSSFRKALLAAKRKLADAQRQERRLFLQSFSLAASTGTASPLDASIEDIRGEGEKEAITAQQPILRQRHAHAHHRAPQTSLTEEDQQAVGASGNVTSALRRTHDIIAAELARSEFAHQTLTESSAALAKLDESYGSLEGMLARSRDLLGTLVRSQKSDTWYLQTALYILLTTGAWLVFRRLLYGPAWWLIWLPIRLIYSLVVGGGGVALRYAGSGTEKHVVVVEEDAVDVSGLPNDELPTADVGGKPRQAGSGDPDSLLEKVAEIVENATDTEIRFEEGAAGDGPASDPDHVAPEEAVHARDEL